MSINLVLSIVIGVLIGSGVYLVLKRSLTRVLVGTVLIGNGANLLFLVAGGRAGGAPIVGKVPESEMADPLPQAMVLTAIVITLGMTAFLLAMAYRSWQISRHDEVMDDVEDRRILRLVEQGYFDDPDEHSGTTPLPEPTPDETRDEYERAQRHERPDEAGNETKSDADHRDTKEGEVS